MKTPHQTPPSVKDRNDRLKTALQANLARRKAQTRARDAQAKQDETTGIPDPDQE